MTDSCRTCGAWLWPWSSQNHKCPPAWCVQQQDHHDFGDPDDCRVIHAHTLEDAAEDYAKRMDEPWTILNNPLHLNIWRCGKDPSTAKKVTVTGESDIVYSVEGADEDEDEETEALGYGSPAVEFVVPDIVPSPPVVVQQVEPDVHSIILADARQQHAQAFDTKWLSDVCLICNKDRSAHPTQDQEHADPCTGTYKEN